MWGIGGDGWRVMDEGSGWEEGEGLDEGSGWEGGTCSRVAGSLPPPLSICLSQLPRTVAAFTIKEMGGGHFPPP